jgi:hypothetical protein
LPIRVTILKTNSIFFDRVKKFIGTFALAIAGICVVVLAVAAYKTTGVEGSLRILSLALLPLVAMTLAVIGGKAGYGALSIYLASMDEKTLKVFSSTAQAIFWVVLLGFALIETYTEVSDTAFVCFVVSIISFIGIDGMIQREKLKRMNNAK